VERLPQLGLYRIATGTALILAPALLLLDNLLHPEELERGNQTEQVGLIADAYTRWQVAHAIGFVAILVFCAALLGLAFLVRRRQPLLGLAGGLLGLVGLVGFAAAITIDGFTWGVVGVTSVDPRIGAPSAASTLQVVQESRWALMYYLATIGFVAGMLMLAVGAARQGAVPAWAAGLLVLAVVMVASETAIISNAYFIAGAAVFLVAGIATALPILRMSDHEFARGGPAAASP
jgi:hypothetical protein